MKLLLSSVLVSVSVALCDTWYNPVNIKTVRISRYDGAVQFTTDGGFPSTRIWKLKTSTAGPNGQFKIMSDALVTAKVTGSKIKMNECGISNASIDEYFVCEIEIQ